MSLTLGSLFDGSGGFPLAARMVGIRPVWASEIDEYCIRVTKKNFPEMKHLGDITKINGAEIEPVDIISFGSPCQDLSIGGKREGLSGERSGLFMEAIRVIKEMRDATERTYPNYIVWENVVGCQSSNAGEDFRIVLEQICQIAEEGFCVPRLEKWTHAGEILADGYNIAWRTLDAQYWGVPQMRRRIFIVADFSGNGCASKILFERDGLQRDFKASRDDRKTVAEDPQGSVDGTGEYLFQNRRISNSYRGPLKNARDIDAHMGTGGNNTPFVVRGGAKTFRKASKPVSADDGEVWKQDNIHGTLNAYESTEKYTSELIIYET